MQEADGLYLLITLDEKGSQERRNFDISSAEFLKEVYAGCVSSSRLEVL
jgi:hypothetical protein